MSDPLASRRPQSSGRSALRVLHWLARTGPAPEDATATAFAWSDRQVRKCATQLIADGYLRRQPMAWGHGALLAATVAGVDRVRAPARARTRPPAPLWWDHHIACAWTAAWLTVRGRVMQGAAEVEHDDSWSEELRWSDRVGEHTIRHRPDLAWLPGAGGRVAVEVELSAKSNARLAAVLELHAAARAARRSSGVIYICRTTAIRDRVARTASERGLSRETGGGLRVELLDAIRDQALDAARSIRAERRIRTSATAASE